MKPTIYDIAKLAGVSTATVSKVFNGTGNISDKTKLRIMDISTEMNYRPSVLASALAGKKTYTLGLLIPDLANPFFAEIARNIEDRANELDFNLVICSTDNNTDKEIRYIHLLRQKKVDGIIIATGISKEVITKELIDQDIPIASIAREISLLSGSAVIVDDFTGGYTATEHLVQLGHKKVAIIAENLSVMSSRERIRGYRYALEEAGIPCDENLILISDFTLEAGKAVARKLFEAYDASNRPTAIFACNDLLAIGVMQVAKENDIKIPEQLSIVGFDNTILASITDPQLTTIAQPIQAMGRQVVDIIINEINIANTVKQRVVLSPELVVRGSTKSPQ